MVREALEESSIVQKDLFIVSFSVFNVFLWQHLLYRMIGGLQNVLTITVTQSIVIWTIYYSVTIGSSIVGSILSSKMSRLKLLYFWAVLGVVSSLLPGLLSRITFTHLLLISVLFGVSFGLGMPSCLAYFVDYTCIENRGLIGGIIFLMTNLSAPPFVISFSIFNLKVNSIVLAVWRAFGLVVFFLKPKERIVSGIKRKTSFISILCNKPFAFYFTAWLIFNLIESFERPILDYIFGDFHYLIMAPIIGSFFALIAGALCDRIGRKHVVLYGFVAMGIAYAIIGIAPTSLPSWYFFLTTESISWAIFFVTFILILWGDLSQYGNREKYYVIGVVPFFLSDIIRMLLVPYVAFIQPSSAFSVASFFLFLAVLPLLYAPETLPERKIELRRLRKYVEKAKKIQQKYVEKTAGK